MGYRVHQHEDKYKVVNVDGGKTSDMIDDLELANAQEIARSLNQGGGFCGHTPEFFKGRLKVSV